MKNLTSKTITKLLIGIIFTSFILNLFMFSGKDLEIDSMEHYIGDIWYYGGNSRYLREVSPGEWKPIYFDAEPIYFNIFKFDEKETKPKYNLVHIAGVDRLFIPFFLNFLSKLTLGKVSIDHIIRLFHLLAWTTSIYWIYQLSLIYFKNKNTALISAALTVPLPVFTILMNSVKMQEVNGLFLLPAAYIHEKFLFQRRNANPFYFIALTAALVFIGVYSSGGHFYLMLYLIARYLLFPEVTFGNLQGVSWWKKALQFRPLLSYLGFSIALFWVARTNYIYRFFFASEQYNIQEILRCTKEFIRECIYSAPVHHYKFLNFPGFTFFTEVIPLITKSFVEINPLLLTVVILSVLYKKGSYKYFIMSLFFLATFSSIILPGLPYFYGPAATGTLFFWVLTASPLLNHLLSSKTYIKQCAALLLVTLISMVFTGDELFQNRFQFALYFGNSPNKTIYVNKKVIVYYDQARAEY